MPWKFNPFTGNFDYYVKNTTSVEDSFTTIQPDSGTSPVAGVSSTLTLTSSDSTLSIAGNSATDTIDFTLPQGIATSDSPTFAGLSLTADLAVTEGGTGASTAADARTNLGLVIGTNVQAWDADLDAIAGLSSADGNFIVGSATGWVAESGSTARTSLGLAIGSDVQAHDADLDALAALDGTAGYLVKTAANTYARRTLTGTSNQVSITNGDGTTGDPVFSLPQDIHTSASPTFNTPTLTNLNFNVPAASNGGFIFRNSTLDVQKWAFQYNSSVDALYIYHYDNSGSYLNAPVAVSANGQLQLPITGSSAGILLGGDTNLYRSSANVLKTDDTFDANAYKVGGTAGVSGSFTTTDGKTVTVTNGIVTSIL